MGLRAPRVTWFKVAETGEEVEKAREETRREDEDAEGCGGARRGKREAEEVEEEEDERLAARVSRCSVVDSDLIMVDVRSGW